MAKNQTGIKANRGRSYAELDSIASRWRNYLGYKLQDPFNARSFFDTQLGELTLASRGASIEVVEHVVASDVEGFTRWDVDGERLEVALSETTHQRLQGGNARARFTVCHEFGHAVLHTDELIKLAGLPLVTQAALHRKKEHAACFDSEWQANAFAASLLMPCAGVRALQAKLGYLNESVLVQHYQVSLEAAQYRIQVLPKI